MNNNLSWQSRYWLNCLKEIIPTKRMNIGINYYKTHQIHESKIENNCFIVKIESDEDGKLVETRIRLREFTKKEKNIINTLKYQKKYVNLIEKNIFPEELHDELFKLKINLFPSSIINIDLNCNCSKQKTICEHVIASLYSLTFELEKNPFLLFTLKKSKITSLPYKSDNMVTKEEKRVNKGIKNVSDLFNNKIEHKTSENTNINYNNIPDLKNNISLLNENTKFYEGFKYILEEIYQSFNEYYEDRIISYDIHENGEYNDFIKLQPIKKNSGSNLNYNNYFKRKWGKYDSWKTLQININSNYSITKINTQSKDTISKYKSEKILFGFLTELKQLHSDRLSKELSFLITLYDFSLELIKKNAIIPEFFTCNDKCLIRWIPSYSNNEILSIIQNLSNNCPELLVTFNMKRITPQIQIITCLSLIIKGFIDNLLEDNQLKNYKDDKIVNLFLGNAQRFNEEENDINTMINNWLEPFKINKTEYTIYFEIKEEQKSYKIDVKIKLEDKLEDILSVLNNCDDIKLKTQLNKDIQIVKEIFPSMNILIEQKEDIILTAREFSNFFNDVKPMLETIGLKIIIPKSLNRKFHPRLTLEVENNSNQNYLSIKNLYKFDWKVAIADKTLTIKEFEKLTKESQTLIRIADKNIILDKHDVEEIIKKIDKLPETLSNYELIKCVATNEYLNINIDIDKKIKNQILNPKGINIPLPQSLNANLRPYQLLGYKWLAQNLQSGFGSILADDMGLGKTLQVLTLILKLKEENLLNEKKVLIIAPTSLLINWEREINKFTPKLSSFIYHGPDRSLKNKNYDILITSYAMIRQDKNKLNKKKWLLKVVDEAQNIKNSQTQQTKAIKSIKSEYNIALTGTPIENRLSEYWSIFDFVNPNYLGTLNDFKKNYILPIENDRNHSILSNLKQVTSPFILRRLKTDKEIIKELPDKISNDVYCNLTPTQAAIYQETLNTHMKTIEQEEGINRRGHVLELINALKQICNHPAQYSNINKVKLEDSGKMQLLIDEIKSILESDEKVLIFTQYVKTGNIIKKLIEKHLDEKVLFLHGSLSRKERDTQIRLFQENSRYKIFVLSLRAGGTGLNLTAATNVIHYDLWWNPAVENQATDRAYRIGQTKNVMVYRFITTGTFEEKINDMIEDKKELAEITIGNGGSFITEMNNEKLRELLRLNK
ncbi:MAG: DEAD/DEAH box helicase [Methanosphaera stadtmanae]|nr:DEAD/DEAH box helicase [Methanosphaera stadtmanae]